jgi:hypothetical protein
MGQDGMASCRRLSIGANRPARTSVRRRVTNLPWAGYQTAEVANLPHSDQERGAGGPRFWRERLNEIRYPAAVRAWPAGRLNSNPENSGELRSNAAFGLAGTVLAAGKYGHFGWIARNARPDFAPSTIAIIAQWCLPLRRQHGGKLESVSTMSNGAISGKLSEASRIDANARRIFAQ